MTSNDIERARRQELAAESAIGGLGRDEWLELRRQAGASPATAEQEAMERAAAAIDLALQPRLEPMPRHLYAAIAANADRHFAPRRAPKAAQAPRSGAPPAWFSYGGWVAAAASFVAAVGLVLLDRPEPPARDPGLAASSVAVPSGADNAAGSADTPSDAPDAPVEAGAADPRRLAAAADAASAQAGDAGADRGEATDAAAGRETLASQRFVLRRNWAPAGDPAGNGVRGDVVWDARTQTGYMRFAGLRRNDPAIEQYQLWIFDARRDERYPVDGGVFDVRGDGGEVVVPIRARLPVGSPRAFAVTIERPGGVVVSDRSRVVVIARVG
jgi:hypothetical protein